MLTQRQIGNVARMMAQTDNRPRFRTQPFSGSEVAEGVFFGYETDPRTGRPRLVVKSSRQEGE